MQFMQHVVALISCLLEHRQVCAMLVKSDKLGNEIKRDTNKNFAWRGVVSEEKQGANEGTTDRILILAYLNECC